jgi:hypothetical protein
MKAKGRYEKPELVVIDLKAEEVLAVGCKTIGKTAFGRPEPNCGQAIRCSQLGS